MIFSLRSLDIMISKFFKIRMLLLLSIVILVIIHLTIIARLILIYLIFILLASSTQRGIIIAFKKVILILKLIILIIILWGGYITKINNLVILNRVIYYLAFINFIYNLIQKIKYFSQRLSIIIFKNIFFKIFLTSYNLFK